MSDCCSVTCITLSTLGCSEKAMTVKRGKENTRTYGIVYFEQSVCNAAYEQRWFQSPQLSQLSNINLGTSCLLWMLPTEFLTVLQTLSSPSRHQAVVVSVTLALIHVNYSVISHCIMTSARSGCIYSTFLEDMEKKNGSNWTQLASKQFPKKPLKKSKPVSFIEILIKVGLSKACPFKSSLFFFCLGKGPHLKSVELNESFLSHLLMSV